MALTSVQLSLTAQYNPDALRRAVLDSRARHSPEEESLTSYFSAGPNHAAGPSTSAVFTMRVWWRLPSLWRDDAISSDGADSRTVVAGDEVSAFSAATGVVNRTINTTFAVQSAWPASVPVPSPTIQERIRALSLVIGDRFSVGWNRKSFEIKQVCARSARRIAVSRNTTGVGRSGARLELGLWSGLDSYEWCEDMESGLVLSFSAIADSVVVASYACDSFEVNTELPQSIFESAFPSNTPVVTH